MHGQIYLFMLFLFIITALVRDRFAVTVLYVFLGAFWLGRWWIQRAAAGLRFERIFEPRAFPDQIVPVKLQVRNPGWLPVPWLWLQDNLPIELSDRNSYRIVTSLAARETQQFDYQLRPRKRGYFPVGPLRTSSGDLLGFMDELKHEGLPEHLTVYPRVIRLEGLRLPSRLPLGALRHPQPIFEDPNRPIGKRPYQTGDSLRRVDWKASAASSQLQVKLFEPSVDLHTALFLNMNAQEYPFRQRIDASELAIVVAASLAAWVIERKQSVGLWTNGVDQLTGVQKHSPLPLLPRKGRPHLMRVLETLARLQIHETNPFVRFLNHSLVDLSWGTSLVVITGEADEALFDELLRARRRGLEVSLVICGQTPGFVTIRGRARQVGIRAVNIVKEKDLEVWQG